MGELIGYVGQAGSPASVVENMRRAFVLGGEGAPGCAYALRTRMPYTFWRAASRQRVLEACNHNITTLCYFVIWREWKGKRDSLGAYAQEIIEEIASLTGVTGQALTPEIMHQIG